MGVLSLLSVTHLRIKLDLISLKRMKKTVIPPAYVTHRYLKKNQKHYTHCCGFHTISEQFMITDSFSLEEEIPVNKPK